jgi:putative ABC transport system substrate-binding protein
LGFSAAGPQELIVTAFRQGLSDSGYIEGRNVAIEYRLADGQNSRLPGLAADLVRRRVAVIVASGTPATLAAKAATTSIPIVFHNALDPIKAGLAASLNKPGGNMTGVSTLGVELGLKRLEVLRELIPKAMIIAQLINPSSPDLANAEARETRDASLGLGLQLKILNASSEKEITAAFTTLQTMGAAGLLVGADPFFFSRREQIVSEAARHSIPTMYFTQEYPAAGGLMSYGGNLRDTYHVVGIYTGRVLKSEKPADLPIQQLTKIELVINLKAANALGLSFPLSLLGRADEVIE